MGILVQDWSCHIEYCLVILKLRIIWAWWIDEGGSSFTTNIFMSWYLDHSDGRNGFKAHNNTVCGIINNNNTNIYYSLCTFIKRAWTNSHCILYHVQMNKYHQMLWAMIFPNLRQQWLGEWTSMKCISW